jgi:hypothetical protein
MKKIYLLAFILILGIGMKSQSEGVYNPVSYNVNGNPSHGVKIKTNLPFQNSSQMPTIIIEGYAYGDKTTIGLILTYYIYGGSFYNPKISSYGGYTPEVILANESGKVVIFINDRNYFTRFSVRVFALGMLAETPENLESWVAVDEPLSGSNQVSVPYENKFAGNILFPSGRWGSDGKVGIGTIDPSSKLDVKGEIRSTTTDNGYSRIGANAGSGGYFKCLQ